MSYSEENGQVVLRMSREDYKLLRFALDPESRCPQCSYKMTGATNCSGEGAPSAGDVSICLNCGQILFFQNDLTLRKVDAGEIGELMSVPESWAVIEKVQRIIKQRGRFA